MLLLQVRLLATIDALGATLARLMCGWRPSARHFFFFPYGSET